MPATVAALGDRDPAYFTHREIDAAIASPRPFIALPAIGVAIATAA